MNYKKLKEIGRHEAIKMVVPDDVEVTNKIDKYFPFFPDVILFGGNYWKSNELIAQFVDEFVVPKSETDISNFLQDIAYRIVSDPVLAGTDSRKYVNVDYQLIYKQHFSLYRTPDLLFDWAEAKGTFIWFEHILSKRRNEQFVKIKKEQDIEKLKVISEKIKKIYSFSDLEIIYLQYFCSQTKLDDLDPSLNTFLYMWSKEQFTGKTTVSEYICSFLNGEETKNAGDHKSKLKNEIQLERFSIPKATTSRCTFLDEGGFFDMTKTYDNFKEAITSNSCEIEYKYKNSKRTKRCYRNYIMSSNNDPIYFVKDETERRILSVHFSKPEETSFKELQKIWHEFVLECNLSVLRLQAIYSEIIRPNCQAGESSHIILELLDILTQDRIGTCGNESYFSVSNIMTLPEIIAQKIPRKIVKEVLFKLYGKPDSNQRFFKSHRELYKEGDFEEMKQIELPF